MLLFFSFSPGKRGVYVHPALPALALASLPLLPELLARPGVRRAGWVLALLFWSFAAVALLAFTLNLAGHKATEAVGSLPVKSMLLVYVVLCGAGLLIARRFAPLAAWPVAVASLCIAFSYTLAPAMDPERSASGFTRDMLARVKPEEELALVAYKEQFLLYLDRPTVNFGHRRWLEGLQESYDASAWLNAGPYRVLLVPRVASILASRPNEPMRDTAPTKIGSWCAVRHWRLAQPWAMHRGPFTTTRSRADDATCYVRLLARDLIKRVKAILSCRVDLA